MAVAEIVTVTDPLGNVKGLTVGLKVYWSVIHLRLRIKVKPCDRIQHGIPI